MADTELVEKRLTDSMLDIGEVPLGDQERARLGLGRHSEDIPALVGDGDQFTVHWAGGRGRLGGDPLRDFLQETARVGSLLRLMRRGDALALSVATAASSGVSGGTWWTQQGSVPPPRTAPVRRTLKAGAVTFRLRQREEYVWREGVGFLRDANSLIREAVEHGGWDPADAVAVRLEGERLATLDQFEELLAIDVANIDHLPHQEAAARTVLARMNGRGILADEVGLGKTIEAGLVLKELIIRGLATRVLILCPAPLRDQWRQELHDKFDEDFRVVASGKDEPGLRGDKVIMTQMLATRNAAKLVRPFDLVIVDEAHRVAGRGAVATRDAIGGLVAEAPRTLLLTATPVQNDLFDLFRLVEVLRPGTFRSQREFASRFTNKNDPRRPVNASELRKLVSSVVIRTTRQQANLDRVRRMPPRDIAVTLGKPERQMYDLLVDTLRHHMTGPTDTQRRRHLALRLTASPVAVSRMALRMAQAHEDPRVRQILTEVGHLAADVGLTERDRKALAVITDWVKEHGRVLVFSQHTQTVAGLVRVLDGAGISAATFHGGMAHGAKADSISAFRSGQAKVLISTDAGAEGLNLQVCNCVVNFDLPWNPMRVEQRIGRVHRLTQERDVYIANMFAKDTIDESVYRLLHDKLAMFELLFGQVVTVLGELDDNDQSMEGRVLEALYSGSDIQMRKRLDALGVQLQEARKRATEMIHTDSNLSSWLAEQKEGRKSRANRPEAAELQPQARTANRRRQLDVENFIRRFFVLAGAQITYEAEQFMSVSLPARLSAALEGLTDLHLAFSHRALDVHPEAQLCVVGSEFFELIMAALRSHGDLTGSVREIPEIDCNPSGPHAPWMRLLQRSLQPTPEWSARATYRVQEGTATGNQELAVVEAGSLPPNSNRVEIREGDASPAPIKAVLEQVEKAAADQLQRRLAEIRHQRTEARATGQSALVENLETQLEEVRSEIRSTWAEARLQSLTARKAQLKRALVQARTATVASDDTELRAEILALELHGSHNLELVEVWEHPSGAQHSLSFSWPLPAGSPYRGSKSDAPLQRMAICGLGHSAEASEVLTCASCSNDSCEACAPAEAVHPCPLCLEPACPACRNPDGLCPTCAHPTRQPEGDTRWERAWRVTGDRLLLVGERHAVLLEGDHVLHLVPDADLKDPARVKIRALAGRLNLPPGTGLRSDGERVSEGHAPPIWSEVQTEPWWDTDAAGGSRVDEVAAQVLPELTTGTDVCGETSVSLASLLVHLRQTEHPPPAPCLIPRPLVITRRIDSVGPDLVFEERWQQSLTGSVLAWRERVVLETPSHTPTTSARAVATARVRDVRIEVDALHRSYLVRAVGPQVTTETFVARGPGVTLAGERAWVEWLRDRDLPTAALVSKAHDVPAAPPVPTSSASEVAVDRGIRTDLVVVSGRSAEPVSDAELQSPPRPVQGTVNATDAVVQLRETLDAWRGETEHVTIEPALLIDDLWSTRFGTATRRYVVSAHEPRKDSALGDRTFVRPGVPLPALADIVGDESALTVDKGGHLVPASVTEACPVCQMPGCAACGPPGSLRDCSDCGRPACGECRVGEPAIPRTTCARCGDRSCSACSRWLPTPDCAVCSRPTCAACSPEGVCATCEALHRVEDVDALGLPAYVKAAGLAAWSANDPVGTRVVALAGRTRLELLHLDHDQLQRWVDLRTRDEATVRACFALAEIAGTADIEVVTVLDHPSSPPGDGLQLTSRSTDEVVWSLRRNSELIAEQVSDLAGRPATPEAALLSSAAELWGGPAMVLPERSPSPARAVERLLRLGSADSRRGDTVQLEVRSRHTRETLRISAQGITRWTAVEQQESSHTEPWTQPEFDPAPWDLHEWHPQPDLIAHSFSDGFSAVLVATGDHAALGVRSPDGAAHWHEVAERRVDQRRLLAGRAVLRRSALLSVPSAPNAARLAWPTVLGATLSRRALRPRVTEVAAIETGDEEVALDAVLDAFADGTRPNSPPMASGLDPDLRRGLERLCVGRSVERVQACVGFDVQEAWMTPHAGAIQVAYAVSPDTRQVLLRDYVTGAGVPSIGWCRSKHLTNALGRCRYCEGDTCALCSDVVMLCSLCQIAACGVCRARAMPDRCAACAALAPLGVLERRRAGVSLTAPAWAGSDDRGTVLVTKLKTGWTLTRTFAGADLSPRMSPQIAYRLTQVLGQK